jgi:hypothetical protein
VKFFTLLLAVAALAAVSCERIPPSVSIPGYGEKKAAKEKSESQSLGADENPPAFFPATGDSTPAPSAAASDDDGDKDGDGKDDD